MKVEEEKIKRITYLRQHGYSIPEISRECSLPKSTVSRYVKEVKILPDYYQRWLTRRNASKIMSEKNWQAATAKAMLMIDGISKKELVLIVAMLYWAEGSKRDLCFSNSDPRMIRIFVSIIRDVFNVSESDIIVSLRIYNNLQKQSCLQYWSDVTGLELNEHTSVDVLVGSKEGKLQYGMCRVRVRKGGLLLKELFSIINRVVALA